MAETTRREYRYAALGRTDLYERRKLVMRLEQRDQVKRLYEMTNWKQDEANEYSKTIRHRQVAGVRSV